MKVLIGDIFESPADTLVNTVNCVGIMGKGIAQEFKKRYPNMFKEYEQKCAMHKVQVGEPYHYKDILGESIVNFPTKKHWRSASRLKDIVNGLDFFIEHYETWGIQSIAFPPLGCGNGGLDWVDVGPLMYQKLSNLDIPIEIYAPFGVNQQQIKHDFLSQSIREDDFKKGKKNKKINPSWVAILKVIHELEKEPYANPIGRTIFQKICYILTEQGIDTGFTFTQSSYGPFSSEVKEAMNVFANMNLVSEKQLGNMSSLTVGPEYKNIFGKYANELAPLENKINKTVDLFSRIKNTEQAEEVATIIYATRKLKESNEASSITEQELYDYVIDWKKKWDTEKKRTTIASTIRNLEMLDWINLNYSESFQAHI